MIDVHCHLLPNIDDGSKSVEQSVSVLRQFAVQGVTDVILTPHVRSSTLGPDGDAAVARRERAFQALRAAAPQAPRLSLGFEIMLDQPLPTLAIGDRRFSLAGSRYYLVEFPLSVVPHFAATVLHQMSRAGAIPLVAHPERYDACSPATVAEWREAGARIQVDATTLTRPTTRGERARALLAGGAVDLLAADNHGDRRSLLTAARYLEPYASQATVLQLVQDNPGAIVRNEDMPDGPAIEVNDSLWERFRRLLRGSAGR